MNLLSTCSGVIQTAFTGISLSTIGTSTHACFQY
jgi:hypothetical protein